jgi:large subunit ribosomal protein L14e
MFPNDHLQLVITDVVDHNRALVDAPEIVRTVVNFKRLTLTDIKIDVRRLAKKKELKEAIEAGEVHKKWAASSWGRKLAVQQKRASLGDFDRFKVMVARVKRSSILKRELAKLRKAK